MGFQQKKENSWKENFLLHAELEMPRISVRILALGFSETTSLGPFHPIVFTEINFPVPRLGVVTEESWRSQPGLHRLSFKEGGNPTPRKKGRKREQWVPGTLSDESSNTPWWRGKDILEQDLAPL